MAAAVRTRPTTGAAADVARAATAKGLESPLLALLRRHYAARARDMLRPLLEVMNIARNVCAGNAEKSEILLVIALRTVEHPDFAKLSYEEIAAGSASAYSSLGTNVRSIADSTAIPRETVRRKVAELVAAGWVERNGNRLFLSPRGSPALTPLRDALIRLVAANYDLVNALLRSTEAPASAPD